MIHDQAPYTQKFVYDDLNNLIQEIEINTGKSYNTNASSRNSLRFGTKGSLAVNLIKAVWHDFESEQGGHLQSLLNRKLVLPSVTHTLKKSPTIDIYKSVERYLDYATPCNNHPYLSRKKVSPSGFFVDKRDNLLIPKFKNGELRPCGLEMRNEAWPTPKQIKGSISKGAYNYNLYPSSPYVTLSEGIADMLAISQNCEITSYCAFSANNLFNVAKYIRSKTQHLILIGADNDRKGLESAKQCLNNIPNIAIWHCPCDCCNDPNDFLVNHGKGALKQQITGALLHAQCD